MNTRIEIGIASTRYDEDGNVISTVFKPTLEIKGSELLLTQLEKLKSSTDVTVLRNNSTMVLADWFNTMNDIELADREKFEIVSESINCIKHGNGVVAECDIRFSFVPVVN